ncbi:MAG: hypothetical protein JMM77_00245 [Candidatus Xiphinematobacter sp.]|nr:MAG: hypothetical protein JMM77_00245 [Candidatus Xiphinematobacter sp.]
MQRTNRTSREDDGQSNVKLRKNLDAPEVPPALTAAAVGKSEMHLAGYLRY